MGVCAINYVELGVGVGVDVATGVGEGIYTLGFQNGLGGVPTLTYCNPVS